MDKASIVKDAIDYIQELQKEERRMMAEVAMLEEKSPCVSEISQDDECLAFEKRRGKRCRSSVLAPGSLSKPCIQVMEVNLLLFD